MRRDLSQLDRAAFDLIVVGGGIHGAWAALDAAQRGLRVCLLERGDFGAATSGNSQRIIHGGLRYLQHADLSRFRQSVRERRILLQTAPQLVRPLPVLAPTMRSGLQHRAIMRCALAVNDLLSLDRNRGLAGPWRIAAGRTLSRGDCEHLAPGIDFAPYTGGALFFDAQITSSERHMLSIVAAAAAAGAQVANYACVEEYLRQGERVAGVQVRDVLSGAELEVRGRMVLNCAGPWTAQRLAGLGSSRRDPRLQVFKASVLLVRNLGLKAALALPGPSGYVDSAEVLRKHYRNYFITPWRGLTLVGTFYGAHQGPAERCCATPEEVDRWLDQFNAAWSGAALGREDVRRIYTGLLPWGAAPERAADFQYAKRYAVLDHERDDGIAGLLSVIGVKYTTARAVAERAVDQVCRRLGAPPERCRTQQGVPPLGPAPIVDAEAAAAALAGDERQLRRAVERAIREEMACTLSDVVLRRTDCGAAGLPGDEVLARCASMMGEVLGWDLLRIEREVIQTRTECEQWSCAHAA